MLQTQSYKRNCIDVYIRIVWLNRQSKIISYKPFIMNITIRKILWTSSVCVAYLRDKTSLLETFFHIDFVD